MNLNLLSNFMVLVEDMNLTKAAQKLFLTQSALSKQMSSLEHQLEVSLFIRDGRSLYLTPAGEVLKEHALTLLREFQLLQSQLVDAASAEHQTLRIQTFSLTEPHFLSALERYRRNVPGIRLELSGNEPDDALKDLLAGRCDAAYITEMSQNALLSSIRDRLNFAVLCQSPACILVNPRHHLAEHKSVSFDDLRKEQLVSVNDPSANRNLMDALRFSGFPVDNIRFCDLRALRFAVNFEGAAAILLKAVKLDVLEKCIAVSLEDALTESLLSGLNFVWLKEKGRDLRPFISCF